MAHILDRAIWNALTTRQAQLARGHGPLRFDADYGLFAATADPRNGEGLTELIAPGGAIALTETVAVALPPDVVVQQQSVLNQMVATTIAAGRPDFAVTSLGDADAEEMLALATLTAPGPFFRKTHRLGDFIGAKIDGRLVAMAGERMKPQGFTEVSGVCTHPDFRGRGYAGALMRIVAQTILDRGETPFLHVYAHNSGAIALYETLGFRFRAAPTLTILTRAQDIARAGFM
jgi:predicted GNAT family acetyltransferase